MGAKKKLNLGWSWTFYWQWPELFKFRKWNWINFDFCHIMLEAGTYKGTYFEFTFVILGIGFYVEVCDKTTRSVFLAEMDQRIAEAKEQIDARRAERDGDDGIFECG